MNCYWEYRRNHRENYEETTKGRYERAREIRTCAMCGTEFEVRKKVIKRFCSDKCRIKYSTTKECYEKRLKTMIKHYGHHALLNRNNTSVSEKYRKTREEKYQELCNKSDLEIIEYTEMHRIKVKCRKCGAEFITPHLGYLHYDILHCKNCSDYYKHCKPSIILYDFLDSIGVEYQKNDRSVIRPYEIDIYIPKYKLGIEVNGNYWHCEDCNKNRDYHLMKVNLCKKQGVKLLHIFEDEVYDKLDIIKSNILELINATEVIDAVNLEIKEVPNDMKKDFLVQNCIQGNVRSNLNIGLFKSKELIGLVVVTKNKDNITITRSVNKLNLSIKGIIEAAVKFIKNKYNNETILHVIDTRYNMFAYEGVPNKIVMPSYWVIYKYDMFKRIPITSFNKSIILKENPLLDKNKKLSELLKELQYYRIFDCGKLIYKLDDI